MKNMNNLKNYSTKELQEELSKREGIKTMQVEPYEEYKVSNAKEGIISSGPVIITINED